MEPLRFVVIGLGGYGLIHIDAVKWLATQGLGTLAGVVALPVDRQARAELAESLQQEGVQLYESVEEFYSAGAGTADVLTVPIGIHLHVPVSVRAMQAGLHVYCEKPVAATVQEVDRLIMAERATGRRIAIGFQHLYSNAIQQLKARICDGRLGPVRSIALMCGWPRSRQYYTRNEWTGRLKLGEEWILDSPANNAHSHYLLNVLYLASSDKGRSAVPLEVRAELYRANDIEGPDTVQIRMKTPGAEAFVMVSHANGRENPPYMELECENGRAYWQTDNGKTLVRYRDGKTEEFDNLIHPKWRYDAFADLVEAVAKGRSPLCTPTVARAQTLAVNAMHESCPEIRTIAPEYVSEVEDWEMFPPNTKGVFRRVRGLDEVMRVAMEERAFFSELGVAWAGGVRSLPVAAATYTRFPSSSGGIVGG
jgi:predicted dehydrogenase